MSRPWFVEGLVLVVVLALGAVAAPASTAGQPAATPVCAPSIPLVWVDHDGSAAPLLAEAEREAARVWSRAGVGLTWARSGPSRTIRSDEILIVVRATLIRHRDQHQVKPRTALGRLIRVSADRPGRVIEVARADIVDAVLPQTWRGRRVRDFPQPMRELAIGRALGRVVAHEIGHWLFGRDHAPTGLMRASIRRPDLVAEAPPPLPAAWIPAAPTQLRTHRPCPAPHAVHQPITE